MLIRLIAFSRFICNRCHHWQKFSVSFGQKNRRQNISGSISERRKRWGARGGGDEEKKKFCSNVCECARACVWAHMGRCFRPIVGCVLRHVPTITAVTLCILFPCHRLHVNVNAICRSFVCHAFVAILLWRAPSIQIRWSAYWVCFRTFYGMKWNEKSSATVARQQKKHTQNQWYKYLSHSLHISHAYMPTESTHIIHCLNEKCTKDQKSMYIPYINRLAAEERM